MTSKTISRHFPYSPEFLQSIVADVESYPLFLPYVEVIEKTDIRSEKEIEHFTAHVIVKYKLFKEAFSCQVVDDKERRCVNVLSDEGPIKKLRVLWKFNALPSSTKSDKNSVEPSGPDDNVKPSSKNQGCLVSCTVDIELRNFLLNRVVSANVNKMTSIFIKAFAQRADILRRRS